MHKHSFFVCTVCACVHATLAISLTISPQGESLLCISIINKAELRKLGIKFAFKALVTSATPSDRGRPQREQLAA